MQTQLGSGVSEKDAKQFWALMHKDQFSDDDFEKFKAVVPKQFNGLTKNRYGSTALYVACDLLKERLIEPLCLGITAEQVAKESESSSYKLTPLYILWVHSKNPTAEATAKRCLALFEKCLGGKQGEKTSSGWDTLVEHSKSIYLKVHRLEWTG